VRLHYDEATERFRAELDAWLDEHFPSPDEAREQPQSSAHVPEWARRWQRSLFDAGWLVPGWPPELGGRNATPVQQMVYFEELAKRQIWRSHNIQGVSIFAPSVVDFGTEEQKQRWALPVLRAERTTCLGMSEPGAGSDLAGLSTRAELHGDHFVVNGQKVWTSGAHHADFCICFVRTDPAAPKHRGISVLLLEMSTPGITVRPLPSLVDRTSWVDFNEVFFDDVVVPRENLLGDLNDGWRVANASLGHERGMLWVWESARLDRALEVAVGQARRAHRSEGRVGERARVRDSLADAYVDALALRCLGYRGFAKFARGRPAPEHMLLKLFGSEANQKLFLECTEGSGAQALDVARPEGAARTDDEWPWANRYLASFGTTISGGTSEIQRNIIAERILGLPR
jgi:alkylation response protein AidB-like acyl-CoA dehydrogenase